MKKGIWAGFWLASFVFLAGCKGFWDLPPSTSTTTTTPTTLSSGVFYVLDQTTGQIVAYSISSGSLNKIGSYSIPGPAAIAIAPNGTFLYVSTLAEGIYVYGIGSGGTLTEENNNQAISSDPAAALQVDTTNSWLVDAFLSPTTGQVQVDAIPLNSSGTYTAGSNVPSASFTVANAAVKQMAISPDDNNVFLALGTGGTIVVPFSSGSLGATATTIGPVNTGGSALSVAVDPSSTPRLFYIGETLANSTANSGGLRVFNYSSLGSGTLTQASGSPIASGGLAPNAILPAKSGEYVYVANGTGTTSSGNIAWFPITTSGTTYTIASGNSIASGIQPIGLAEDSDDNFVLAVATGGSTSSGNPDLEAYTMSSGALTSALQKPTGTDPVGAVAIAALP
jgi:hypothetical protein